MVQKGYILEGEPKVIRRMRFEQAKIVDISEDGRVTFSYIIKANPFVLPKKINKWAYFDEENKIIKSTLIDSIDSDVTVNILVHRRLLTYTKKGEPKKKYDKHDFIVQASFTALQ